MSCSSRSVNAGTNVLLRARTGLGPVVRAGTWQPTHPICAKIRRPRAWVSADPIGAGGARSRTNPSAASRSPAESSGSGVGSTPAGRGLPPTVCSVMEPGFVMPISMTNAPAVNSRSVATWALRPKRPSRPSAVRLGRPEMPSVPCACASASARISASGTASSIPNPRMEGVVRCPVPVAPASAGVTCCWMTGPPVALKSSHAGLAPLWYAAACNSTSSPTAPTTGSSWHSAQLVALNSGPSPVSGVKVVANTALPRANRASWSPVRNDSGLPGAAPVATMARSKSEPVPVGASTAQAAVPAIKNARETPARLRWDMTSSH